MVWSDHHGALDSALRTLRQSHNPQGIACSSSRSGRHEESGSGGPRAYEAAFKETLICPKIQNRN